MASEGLPSTRYVHKYSMLSPSHPWTQEQQYQWYAATFLNKLHRKYYVGRGTHATSLTCYGLTKLVASVARIREQGNIVNGGDRTLRQDSTAILEATQPFEELAGTESEKRETENKIFFSIKN